MLQINHIHVACALRATLKSLQLIFDHTKTYRLYFVNVIQSCFIFLLISTSLKHKSFSLETVINVLKVNKRGSMM